MSEPLFFRAPYVKKIGLIRVKYHGLFIQCYFFSILGEIGKVYEEEKRYKGFVVSLFLYILVSSLKNSLEFGYAVCFTILNPLLF